MRKRTRWQNRAAWVGILSGSLCGLFAIAYLSILRHWFRLVVTPSAPQMRITAEMYVMDTAAVVMLLLPGVSVACTCAIARRRRAWWGLLPLAVFKVWQVGYMAAYFDLAHGLTELRSGLTGTLLAWVTGTSVADWFRRWRVNRKKNLTRQDRPPTTAGDAIWPPPPKREV